MSFKGFQKAAVRAPQNFRSRFNMGEITKDPVFQDAERRFQELEKETSKLHSESRKYFDAINGMLKHQIEFSKACAEIYKPISGRMSDPDATPDEGNPEGIRACEEYESIVHELQETLAPELELIETRIVRPALEMMEIIKVMRKQVEKRDRKQLDYDRHRTNLKKLQEKKDKSAKEEKAMYKAESDVEQATQEYDYFNELMKDELPKLFHLQREFIQPLFQSFYYMQLNVFYTLHEKMQSIDIGYFDLTLDIEEAFHDRRGDIPQQAESLMITHFKATGGKKRPTHTPGQRPAAIEGGHRPLAIEGAKPSPSPSSGRPSISEASSPPPYSASHTNGAPSSAAAGQSSSAGQGGWGAVVANKAKPAPPTKPKPNRPSGAPPVETVTALYDYEAQAQGDLSFSAGDKIEIIHRTGNENEWWTGRVSGKEGQFPGNYVQLDQ